MSTPLAHTVEGQQYIGYANALGKLALALAAHGHEDVAGMLLQESHRMHSTGAVDSAQIGLEIERTADVLVAVRRLSRGVDARLLDDIDAVVKELSHLLNVKLRAA